MERKRIAAVFDVDGTLIAGTSLERIFIGFLMHRRELHSTDLARLIGGTFEGLPLKANKSYLRGKDYSWLRGLAQACFEEEIEPRLLPRALERLRWHRASGHTVALLSGTLDLLLAPLAAHLNVQATSATCLEVIQQRVTGRIVGEHPFGEAKLGRLCELARRFEFDLRSSFAYADHFVDRHLLDRVGHPVATNPDQQLRQLAEARGWMIEDFALSSARVIKPAPALEMARGAIL